MIGCILEYEKQGGKDNMPRRIILTKEEAEKEGRQQVKHQNDITGAQNYKFVTVGSLNECWAHANKTKYFNLHRQLLVWRLDGSEWSSEIGEGDYTKTPVIYKNKKHEYWFVLADYAENSPIWKRFLSEMSVGQKQYIVESNRMHNKYRKR